MRARYILAAAFLSLFPGPIGAAETVPLPAFVSLQLRGGGEVVIRHGASQRVTLVSGNSRVTRLRVEPQNDGRLRIDACDDRCPDDYRLRIEIVTPRLAGIAIAGGGSVRVEGGFPDQDDLGLAVRGGGDLDARALRSASVGASVSGGGSISTHPLRSLGASVAGGGRVRYWGNPRVGTSVRGGGALTRADGS